MILSLQARSSTEKRAADHLASAEEQLASTQWRGALLELYPAFILIERGARLKRAQERDAPAAVPEATAG
jgi:hypothetical protein